jgi:cytochrome c553
MTERGIMSFAVHSATTMARSCRRWLAPLSVAALLSMSLAVMAAPSSAQAQTLSNEKIQLCVSCHGVNGMSPTPDNPHLSKLQTAYFVRQMEDFKKGRRKSPIMEGIAATLDEKDFLAYANYFREQAPPAPGKGEPRLIARGKEIFMEGIVASAVPACAGCHRDDGTGTNRYPRVAGQQPSYLTQQMLNYKNGSRDNDAGGLMRAVATRMTEAEIRAVVEFIVTMKGDEE